MARWPYSTVRWARVRANQLRREPLCRACASEGRKMPAREVDHVTPISAGGAAWDRANLQSLCTAHHSIKTGAFDRMGKDWRKWETRGCYADGSPRDPDHAWHKDPVGGSITENERPGTGVGPSNRVSSRKIG